MGKTKNPGALAGASGAFGMSVTACDSFEAIPFAQCRQAERPHLRHPTAPWHPPFGGGARLREARLVNEADCIVQALGGRWLGGALGYGGVFWPPHDSHGRLAPAVANGREGKLPASFKAGWHVAHYLEALVRIARRIHSLPFPINNGGVPFLRRLLGETRRPPPPLAWVLIVGSVPLAGCGQRGARSSDEVSDTSIALKRLTPAEVVAVFGVCQLSRQLESRDDKPLQPSDLRESGQLEQDADVALFVYREEYYLERAKPADDDTGPLVKWMDRMERARGMIDVICAKQRGGPIGTKPLRANLGSNVFWEDWTP